MKFLSSLVLALTVAVSLGQSQVEIGGHAPSQAAADVLRDFAGTDGAFLAAGLVKSAFQKDDLATLVQYPTEEIVVITLSGSEVKRAFERSLALYPMGNTSFLQISGFEVAFSKDAPSGQRIQSVRCNNQPLEESKNYQIAMPSSLGRGGLGYFKIWDKTKITKTYDNATLESVLKGKRFVETPSRWLASESSPEF